MEATCYYAGLPSRPRLLARTGTAEWQPPKGLEAYHKVKQLGVVVNHKLNHIWEDQVAPKVQACLDEKQVQWTSLDVVRIGEVGASSTITLWIGVKPDTLNAEEARIAAFCCLDVLKDFDITDVDVELRESLVIRSAGPQLLPPTLSVDPTAEVRHPLTHALGLHITPMDAPSVAGTGGFFLTLGGDANRLLLITARHVVFPPETTPNHDFDSRDKSQRRSNVLLLGDKAYTDLKASIRDKIGQHELTIVNGKSRIQDLQSEDDEMGKEEREVAQSDIAAAAKAIEALEALFNDVKKNWATTDSRVLGHVVYSPPLRFAAGTLDEQYTQDYAIIEVDDGKIDRTTFHGNAIYLGDELPAWEFNRRMHPSAESSTPFKLPYHRLLKLHGTIPISEMRNPTMKDANGDPSMIVIKRGSATRTTIGRASSLVSFTRQCTEHNLDERSKEWPILPYDHKSGPFSRAGDSGAVIADGLGRIGGLLNGGAGTTDSIDITYATPIDFLMKSIKARYPDAHPNPGSADQTTLQ